MSNILRKTQSAFVCSEINETNVMPLVLVLTATRGKGVLDYYILHGQGENVTNESRERMDTWFRGPPKIRNMWLILKISA